MLDHSVPKENLITLAKTDKPGNACFDGLALRPIQMFTVDTKPGLAGDDLRETGTQTRISA